MYSSPQTRLASRVPVRGVCFGWRADGKYVGWNAADAVKDYISRINAKIPVFEPLTEEDFTYIKMINVNQRIEVRNTKGNSRPLRECDQLLTKGYLASRVCFYLMNLHTQRRTLYFARAGKSQDASFKADAELSPEGKDYAQKLAGRLLEFRREEEERELAQGDKPRPLIVPPLCPFL
jgi:6-phosphofructo-2-kinase / fructose-2,6-biphosphatase 4